MSLRPPNNDTVTESWQQPHATKSVCCRGGRGGVPAAGLPTLAVAPATAPNIHQRGANERAGADAARVHAPLQRRPFRPQHYVLEIQLHVHVQSRHGGRGHSGTTIHHKTPPAKRRAARITQFSYLGSRRAKPMRCVVFFRVLMMLPRDQGADFGCCCGTGWCITGVSHSS